MKWVARQGRLRIALLSSLTIALLVSLFQTVGFFRGWQLRSTDFLYGTSAPSDEIVIVAIDDASLQRLGELPWPRAYYARLIELLQGARVISIDVLFGTEEPDDAALIEATARAGNVIFPALAVLPERSRPGVIRAQMLIQPPPSLQTGSAGLGVANVLPDPDGVVRRLPLVVQVGDEYKEALCIQVLRRYLGLPPSPPGELKENHFVAGPLVAPVDAWGRMEINFVGPPGSFPSLSCVDVLEERIDPAVFRDKIVLVGQMGATGGSDQYIVPTSIGGRQMAGVEIQANAIHTALNHRFLSRQGLLSTIAVIFSLSLLSGLLASWLKPLQAAGGVVLLAVGYLLMASILFDQGVILNILYPLSSLVVGYVAALALRYTSTELERRRVIEMFGRYVSPQVVNELLSLPDTGMLELGGVQREITVLVADIRGFTSISESLSPTQVVSILNRHLNALTQVAFKHGGTVDKFTGDGILVVFNAPLLQIDHAERAVRAALEMQETSRRLSEELPLEVQVSYGIGINTGEAVVGNIGSEERLEYTVIGDTVNLAFRLQERAARGQILISESTYRRVADMVVANRLGPVQVKGKREPVVIHEVLGLVPSEGEDLNPLTMEAGG